VGPVGAGDHGAAARAVGGRGEGETDRDRRHRLRDAAVAVFNELGQEHPLSLRYRRRLAAALY
jgi:hypothetical protein